MKPLSVIATLGAILAVSVCVSTAAQSTGRSVAAIDAAMSDAQDERAFLQEQFDDTSVLYVSSWIPSIALPVRRDRLDKLISRTIFNPGTTARGIMSDLLRGDREYRRELLLRINELNQTIARLGEEADVATGVATMTEQEYRDQLSFDDHSDSSGGGGILRARQVRIESHGRMSGRDVYTVYVEIKNHGGGKLSFRSGTFDYTVYEPPGRKTNKQAISYRQVDLGPGEATIVGNSCEGPPPDYRGTWSAKGTAEDTRTKETHEWRISGTCP